MAKNRHSTAGANTETWGIPPAALAAAKKETTRTPVATALIPQARRC
jgi:hypothetical protein